MVAFKNFHEKSRFFFKKSENIQNFIFKNSHNCSPWAKFSSVAEGVCKTSVLLVLNWNALDRLKKWLRKRAFLTKTSELSVLVMPFGRKKLRDKYCLQKNAMASRPSEPFLSGPLWCINAGLYLINLPIVIYSKVFCETLSKNYMVLSMTLRRIFCQCHEFCLELNSCLKN